jgi:hypothetical protein
LGTTVAADTAVAHKLALHGAGLAIQLTCNGSDAEVLFSETGDGHLVFRLKLLIVRWTGLHLLTLQVSDVALHF